MITDKLKWVYNKLVNDSRTRDNNELLYFKYLQEQGYDTNKSVKEFLQDMSKRRIPYLDSIARASRKIQEECPDLRGKLWRKRQIKETKVREEIRKI